MINSLEIKKIKVAVNYGVNDAISTEVWWILKNIQCILNNKETDPRFEFLIKEEMENKE